MKRVIFPIFLLTLAACGNQQSAPTETANTTSETAEKQEAPADTAKVDAMTSATSHPNRVTFNGTIVLPPQRQATVALTMGGVVRNTSLLPGQSIRKGDVLATLENPDFITLQQTYLDSHAQAEYLRAEYDRQKTLSDEKAASQKKFQQSKADYLSMQSRLEAAAAQLNLLGVLPADLLKNGIRPLLQVKAPISGYIGNVSMNVGKYIQPGEALCEIIDKTAPMLCLTTYEKDLANMKEGSSVQFRVNGMGKETFNATIVSIGQVVDKVNRSLEVYARINDSNRQFRPGMYVTALIQN